LYKKKNNTNQEETGDLTCLFFHFNLSKINDREGYGKQGENDQGASKNKGALSSI
jgi:hypothetical protein